MSKNKLYTKSYFCKRLIQAGFDVIKLQIPYQKSDFRKWTVVVNPGKHFCQRFNVFVTCFKQNNSKDFSFKFQGQNFEDFILTTKSMNLIIKIFKKTVQLFDADKNFNQQKNAFNNKEIETLKENNK